jgi:hypothetical protein
MINRGLITWVCLVLYVVADLLTIQQQNLFAEMVVVAHVHHLRIFLAIMRLKSKAMLLDLLAAA